MLARVEGVQATLRIAALQRRGRFVRAMAAAIAGLILTVNDAQPGVRAGLR